MVLRTITLESTVLELEGIQIEPQNDDNSFYRGRRARIILAQCDSEGNFIVKRKFKVPLKGHVKFLYFIPVRIGGCERIYTYEKFRDILDKNQKFIEKRIYCPLNFDLPEFYI